MASTKSSAAPLLPFKKRKESSATAESNDSQENNRIIVDICNKTIDSGAKETSIPVLTATVEDVRNSNYPVVTLLSSSHASETDKEVSENQEKEEKVSGKLPPEPASDSCEGETSLSASDACNANPADTSISACTGNNELKVEEGNDKSGEVRDYSGEHNVSFQCEDNGSTDLEHCSGVLSQALPKHTASEDHPGSDNIQPTNEHDNDANKEFSKKERESSFQKKDGVLNSSGGHKIRNRIGKGVLRSRSASDEYQNIDNDVRSRSGKKRSFSEAHMQQPPKYKVHFGKNESKAALKTWNDDDDSMTTVSMASISNASNLMHRRNSDGDDSAFHSLKSDVTGSCTTAKLTHDSGGPGDIHSGTIPTKSASKMMPAAAMKATICERRLPSKKRKGSHDISMQLANQAQQQRRKGSTDLSDNNALWQQHHRQERTFSDEMFRKARIGSYDLSVSFEDTIRPRADSTFSMLGDVLLSPRKNSQDTHSSATLPGLGEPAEYYTNRNDGDGNDSVKDENSSLHHTSHLDISALEQLDGNPHLNRTGKERHASHAPKGTSSARSSIDDDDHSGSNDTFASSGHRLLLEAIMMTTSSAASVTGNDRDAPTAENPAISTGQSHIPSEALGRDRLESWGVMSDISLPLGSDSAAMVQLMGSWHHSDLAAAHESPSIETVLFLDDKPESVPSRILMGRERLNSLASLSEASFTGGFSHLPPLAPPATLDVATGNDIQDFVAAAMASIGDQLAELAGAVESAAHFDLGFDDNSSDADTDASPAVIGAVGDISSSKRRGARPRSWSTSSGKISVDYDAVQAAVAAADAASGSLGLTPASNKKKAPVNKALPKARQRRRKLPLKCNRSTENLSSSSSLSDNDCKPSIAKSHQRSKVDAGAPTSVMVHPSSSTPAATATKPAAAPKKTKKKRPPQVKRPKKESVSLVAEVVSSDQNLSAMKTPKIRNKKTVKQEYIIEDSVPMAPVSTADSIPMAPVSNSKASKQQAKQQGQSNQKWESMFDSLVEFVNERRVEDFVTLSEKEKEEWTWDGNVPTNYKSKDGKALGRWVNNQRSAKSKGTLKDEREERLINVGLKWSVLSSNAWNLMLDELTVYINEQAEKGIQWDGNVPTNYQIKTKLDSEFAGEDKNLGRWVNRQRSMFQAGKLRKDRQLALEKIGLKWSMLATTSWDTMYDTLVEYTDKQKKDSKPWDGNVPANYKTDDNPPRSLGRWINRQRSAFIKRKLKQEYVDKLSALGLKWSVHHRPGENECDDGDDSDSDRDTKSRDSHSATKKIQSNAMPETPGPSSEKEGKSADNVKASPLEGKSKESTNSNTENLEVIMKTKGSGTSVASSTKESTSSNPSKGSAITGETDQGEVAEIPNSSQEKEENEVNTTILEIGKSNDGQTNSKHDGVINSVQIANGAAIQCDKDTNPPSTAEV